MTALLFTIDPTVAPSNNENSLPRYSWVPSSFNTDKLMSPEEPYITALLFTIFAGEEPSTKFNSDAFDVMSVPLNWYCVASVSYTHLTLPTIYSV